MTNRHNKVKRNIFILLAAALLLATTLACGQSNKPSWLCTEIDPPKFMQLRDGCVPVYSGANRPFLEHGPKGYAGTTDTCQGSPCDGATVGITACCYGDDQDRYYYVWGLDSNHKTWMGWVLSSDLR